MNTSSDWVVNTSSTESSSYQTGSVMAWARDSITGEPVYILELDKSRIGGKCGCECPSCELPLTAVNAAKVTYIKRPHFRHPNGAESSECMFLAARLAAMQLLRIQGVFLLPRRQMSAQIIGLSGMPHEAWVEQPPEAIRVCNFDFRDKVAAILTLDDGRQLRIQLIGTGTATDSEGTPIPTIVLDLHDPSLASMSPEELRSRLTIAPESLCWVSHWNDPALKHQAENAARLLADGFMDLPPDDIEILDGVDPKFRRETVLHLEVKRILAESNEIRVPALSANAHGVSSNGKNVELNWDRPSKLIPIFDVQLEQRFEGVIPDVIAKTSAEDGGIIMIEVTVTNHISDERLQRIRLKNVSTLEIDLSLSGGLITRAELTEWVVHGLETKRWLHHPEMSLQCKILQSDVDAKVAGINEAENEARNSRNAVLSTPLKKITKDFLHAVFACAEFDGEEVITDELRLRITQAKMSVKEEADKLAIHGYRDAADPELADGRQGIISRIQSIKTGRGVGYRLDSTMAVMNAIRQTALYSSSNHTIYLIAEKAYRNADAEAPPSWFTYWVDEIKSSINRQEGHYIRDGKFDSLLSLLFPEIAAGLANGYGTEMRLSKKPGTQQVSAKGTLAAVERIRDFYHDGAFRHYAPRIIFDDVLKDAEAIKNGDTYEKWFEIWSDRYKLDYQVSPIVQLLNAAGFTEAIKHWHSWNRYINEIRLSRKARYNETVTQSKHLKSDNSVNLYALAKGRDKPRT